MRELDLFEVEMVSGGCQNPGDDCPSGHPYDDGFAPSDSRPPSGSYDQTDPTYNDPNPYPGVIIDGVFYPGRG